MDANIRPKVGIKAVLVKADGTRHLMFDKEIEDQEQIDKLHEHIQKQKESEANGSN